jgi:hypothetical protein
MLCFGVMTTGIVLNDMRACCSTVSLFQHNSTAAEVKETFNLFNKSGSGLISAGELKDIMSALGEKVTDEVRTWALLSLIDHATSAHHARAHFHARTHAHTHTRTHAHIHTRTHVHTNNVLTACLLSLQTTNAGHCQDDQDCRQERQGWRVLC